ncbi:MAG: hypothetical protein NT107_03055 [Planctomycetota bacterium]|nr:hypothetical protein [Planctomycetota bacterium]
MKSRCPLTLDPAPQQGRLLYDSAAVMACTFVACWLAFRGLWHGLDGYQLLSDIHNGSLFHDRHVLYKPIAWMCDRSLQWFGTREFESVVAASMIFTSIGVAFAHRALLNLSLTRRAAATAAAAIASCFCILYFGTVIEFHGVFFGFTGLAWWCFAKFLRSPSWHSAILAGIGSGLSAAAHATGQLLPFVFFAFTLAWSPQISAALHTRAWPSWLARFALMFAAHFATAATVTSLLLLLTSSGDAALKTGIFEGPRSFVSNYLAMQTVWGTAPALFVQEWLMPFLPLSLLPLCALFVPRLRLEGALFGCCLLVYLLATTVLLSPFTTLSHPQYLPQYTLIEYGAYFMPLVFPAAVLLIRLLPSRLHFAMVLATLAVSAIGFARPDRPARNDAFGNAVLQIIDERHGTVLCGGYAELDSVQRLRPMLDPQHFLPVFVLQMQVFNILTDKVHPTDSEKIYPFVTTIFDALFGITIARSGPMFVTDDALRLLLATKDGYLDRLVTEHIAQKYQLAPCCIGPMGGQEVTRKP